MKIYVDNSKSLKQNFIAQVPVNMLIGKVQMKKNGTDAKISKKNIVALLNNSTITSTLIDNHRSIQEVMSTKIPLSFFNDLSSLGEGAVCHALPISADVIELMIKIPVAFVGSLDLNAQKYLRFDLDFVLPKENTFTFSLDSVEFYARQTNTLTNDIMQYKRLNVPDGVLAYEFVPEGPSYVVNGQSALNNTSNVDFIEVTYKTGVNSRIDYYELFSKYYETNEISSRVIVAEDLPSPIANAQFESTIIELETVGVNSIKIVRNDTTTDTTVVSIVKYVSSASDNRITGSNVVKLPSGSYVPDRPNVLNIAELELLMKPQKPYAVDMTLQTLGERLPSVNSDVLKTTDDSLKRLYNSMV